MLVADEPVSALDVSGQASILNLLVTFSVIDSVESVTLLVSTPGS